MLCTLGWVAITKRGDSAASPVFHRVLQANVQGQGEGVARGFNLRTSGGCVPSHSLLSSGFTSRLSSVPICFEILSSFRDGILQANCPPKYLNSASSQPSKVCCQSRGTRGYPGVQDPPLLKTKHKQGNEPVRCAGLERQRECWVTGFSP